MRISPVYENFEFKEFDVPEIKLINQHTIVLHSIVCGVSCFIPIPFVDEIVQQKVGKRMVSNILIAHGKKTEPASKILSRRYANWCFGCLIGLFVYPFKKFIRTVAIFFTVKKVVDECEFWLFKGIMIDIALQLGIDLNDEKLSHAMSKVIRECSKEVDSSVLFDGVKSIFISANKDLKEMAKASLNWMRGRGEIKEIVPNSMVESIERLVTPEFVQRLSETIRSKEVLGLQYLENNSPS